MHKSLRRAASALLIAAVLLLAVSPALAAPRDESATVPIFVTTHGFTELLAWLGSWLAPSPVESHAAPGGHTMDPDGTPAGADPDDIATPNPEGGGTMDPNG